MESMNRKIILAARPNGPPKEENFKLIKEKARLPNDGEVLCKTLYLSLDPYMRGRMNADKSYAKPVQVGEVMEAGGVSVVIESKSPNYKTGDFVVGRTGWQETPTIDAAMLRKLKRANIIKSNTYQKIMLQSNNEKGTNLLSK